MRLRAAFAVPALVAVFAFSGCQGSKSGGSANYTAGSGSGGSGSGSSGSGSSRQPAYAPTPAPTPAPTRSGRAVNTAYIVMTQSCGYCVKLRNNTLTDRNVRAELANFNAQEVFADNPSGRAIAERYRITGFPTTVIVDPSGALVKKIVGYNPPNDYISQLRQAH